MNNVEAERRIREYEAVTRVEGRSTHDLVRDLLAYCTGVTVPFETLYAAINAKLPQERVALRAVLQAYPYFVSDSKEGGDSWSFDPTVHRQLLTVMAAGGTLSPFASVSRQAVDTPVEGPASAAAGGAPAADARSQPRAHAQAREPKVTLPNISKRYVIDLLGFNPRDVMDFLDHLKADFWPTSSMSEFIQMGLDMGWCSKTRSRYNLTEAGRMLVGLPLAGRAEALRGQFRRLPAYFSAEEAAIRQCEISLDVVKSVLGTLPPEDILSATHIFRWLRWVANSKQGEIGLDPEADSPAVPVPTLVMNRQAVAELIQVHPTALLDFLDRLRAGKAISLAQKKIGPVVENVGLCLKADANGKHRLSKPGEMLLCLSPTAKAEVFLPLLRLLPAYVLAEERLQKEGRLDATQLAGIIRLLPKDYRNSATAVFNWLGWTISTRKLGQANTTTIRLKPAAARLP